MKNLIKQLGVAVAITAASSASAVPTLTISDGTTTIVVTDNVGPDINPTAGIVDWNGTIGVWTVNLDSGTTKPALGTATSPHLDLFFKGQSSGAGQLTLTFTDDGFTYNGGLSDGWGGTAQNTVINRVLVDGVTVIQQGPLGPGAFSSTAGASVNLTAANTLSLVVVINHSAAGITTGNKDVKTPEGGSTVAMLGMALLGLGGVTAFRKKQARA